MPTPPVPIVAPGTAPDPSDAGTFDNRSFDWTKWEHDHQVPESNALAQNVYGNAVEAKASADTAVASADTAVASGAVAQASANFKGPWAGLVGALAVPASVSHLNTFWVLLQNLADVTTQTPGSAPAFWQEIGRNFATTIGVGGATASASGAGVSFPAAQSPSTDANTLDDYEEGTWVPVDVSGAGLNITVNDAKYTKIGRVVHASYYIVYPTTADGLTALIGGLPFASSSIQTGTASTPSGVTAAQSTVGTGMYLLKNGGVVTNASLSGMYLLVEITYSV